MATSSPNKSLRPEVQAGAPFDLTSLPEDLMTHVLRMLPVPLLLSDISLVCRRWSHLCETVFQEECKRRKWALPRRPRGPATQHKHFPWRAMYWKHSCIACSGLGEFPVREDNCFTRSSVQKFLVCKRCVGKEKVQKQLVEGNFFVDMIGISGKKLLDKGAAQGAMRGGGRRGRGRGRQEG